MACQAAGIGSPRDPLAVELGLVEQGSGPSAAARVSVATLPDELLLRAPSDSLIAALMDSTSLARMVATVQRLQDFGTRYVVMDSCWAAGYWIRDRFVELGLTDVRLDTFRTMSFQDSVDAMNVIAVKQGQTRPDEYVVIGGHYDSVSAENFDDPYAPAPGAEDNATAVAAVLEAARLLNDVQTDRSIIYACWSAEEEGLWGSRDFVAKAVEESLDIIVYLNMDCIGYLEPEEGVAPVIVFTDSLSLAIAGYMQTLAAEHTPYDLQTCVRPVGASDHTSFWERGYNVVDTGTTISSPWRHTDQDILENIDPAFMRAIGAINVAATAAVAGVVGQEANLPPETYRVENCAATSEIVTVTPTFEWGGVDFDGEVAVFEYRLEGDASSRWKRLPASQTSLTLRGLDEGEHALLVRALDDQLCFDPSPVRYAFTTDASLRPLLTVDTNFLPAPLMFGGGRTQEGDPSVNDSRGVPTRVYDGERMLFEVSSDASHYCGRADSVSVAINDTSSWSGWTASPCDVELRPVAGDTCVLFRTRDENGALTSGRISFRTIPAPRDRPLLHIDDWFPYDVQEATHDAFYEQVLAGESCDVWDPFEHIEGCFPTLPPMEELGRYRTVLWTLDRYGGLLRAAQAESAYHYLEGYVRAGGNLVLEGQSALTSLSGADYFHCPERFDPGCFIHDHVGADSLRNAGATDCPQWPDRHGYAFLGGIAHSASGLPHAPVDTLDKWAEGHAEHGGLPLCEIVRPLQDVQTLYLFDSHINPELDGRPCATLRTPSDGTGSVACFGFPFYYIQTDAVAEMLPDLLNRIRVWQAPAELVSFTWLASPDSVSFSWSLAAEGDTLASYIHRKQGPIDEQGVFARLSEEPILPEASGMYSVTDRDVDAGETYTYRLEVVERWGGHTIHGPWQISAPPSVSVSHLGRPTPNPFSDKVSLSCSVACSGERMTADVFDVAGRLVSRVEDALSTAGQRVLTWDGTDQTGRPVASGVYFFRLTVGDESMERKVVRLR
jgi:hypothetical protein